MALFKRKKNFVIWASYMLLFSTLVFISALSVIYKNTYKVNAQLDIQNFNPTTVPTNETPTNPEGTFRPITSPRPISCVNPTDLQGTVRVGNIITGYTGSGTGRVWYSSNVGGGNLTAEELLASIREIRAQTGLTTTGLRQQLAGLPDTGATCISTGVSPTIFIYAQNTKVQPMVPILYVDDNNEYFYYEYDSSNISFNKPTNGWVVDKSDLKTLSKNLSNTLKLTSIESGRLLFELNFSASDVKSDRLFIGLIPQEEIDKNIPLKIISPNNPKVLRYHFYISPAKEKNALQPKLEEIQRSKSFILEFGSFAEKQ